jgi:anti-sigma regulatory factor (Ser/Thr protein kinase)
LAPTAAAPTTAAGLFGDAVRRIEARQPGGLGIALVKSLMDHVCYTRTTRNVLTIRKHIDGSPNPGGARTDADSTD